VLYFLHSLVFLFLPRLNPKLANEIKVAISPSLLRVAAVVSLISMGALIVIQLLRDVDTLRSSSLNQRITEHSLTSIELIVTWAVVGAALYGLARWRAPSLPVIPDVEGVD
jgi:hypothetical protein